MRSPHLVQPDKQNKVTLLVSMIDTKKNFE